MSEVKICGVRRREDAAAAVGAGARMLGFVFFEKSPRNVAVAEAAALAAEFRGRVATVAVVVDAADAGLEAIQREMAPDFIQAHGAETPERLAALRRFARAGVIKAFQIARTEDVAAAERYAGAADYFLFDAKAPAGAALPGGNGAAFDWRILKGRSFPRPWLLSGGLTPENVREAIAESGAAMVDVSSGVESAPGVKDIARIERFVAAAKAG